MNTENLTRYPTKIKVEESRKTPIGESPQTSPSQIKVDRWASVCNILRYPVIGSFTLYVVALTCSMAAMEILSWLTAFLTLLYIGADRLSLNPQLNFKKTGYGYLVLAFTVAVSLGVFTNAPQDHWVRDLGALRDFFLYFFLFYSLQIVNPIKPVLFIFLGAATVIAIYGIWQHFTGIDLWRHDHRALVQIYWANEPRFATVGFFNHHLTYAYSYCMIACLAWAALLKGPRSFWQTAVLAVSFVLILVSIIYTYGRGAWLSLAIVIPLMTLLSRKGALVAVLGLLMTFVVFSSLDSTFRTRLKTLTAGNYESNRDRKNLWKINEEMFEDHPYIGVGYLENENLSVSYYQREKIDIGMAGHAHNNYLQILSTTGVLGSIFYCGLIFFPLLLTFKLFWSLQGSNFLWERTIALACLGAQLIFHLGGLTQCTISDSKNLHQYVFWVTLALYLYAEINPKLEDSRRRNRPLAN